jgi:predicted transcriptional regulator
LTIISLNNLKALNSRQVLMPNLPNLRECGGVDERAGLTQRELAERADVPQSTIARIEHGQNTSFDTMSKIAFALGKKLKVEFT